MEFAYLFIVHCTWINDSTLSYTKILILFILKGIQYKYYQKFLKHMFTRFKIFAFFLLFYNYLTINLYLIQKSLSLTNIIHMWKKFWNRHFSVVNKCYWRVWAIFVIFRYSILVDKNIPVIIFNTSGYCTSYCNYFYVLWTLTSK